MSLKYEEYQFGCGAKGAWSYCCSGWFFSISHFISVFDSVRNSTPPYGNLYSFVRSGCVRFLYCYRKEITQCYIQQLQKRIALIVTENT